MAAKMYLISKERHVLFKLLHLSETNTKRKPLEGPTSREAFRRTVGDPDY